jgi:hypothetical protein
VGVSREFAVATAFAAVAVGVAADEAVAAAK